MRSKVQDAIDQLGYRTNITARKLATGRSKMIALAFPETNHPYFSMIAAAVVNTAEARGYRVLIEQTGSKLQNEQAVLNDRDEGLVDGVIFHPSTVTSLQISSIKLDIPIVLLGEATIPLTMDHVMIDNVAAAKVATKHLIDAGCRRIAFLGAVDGDQGGATIRRLIGYQDALNEAQIMVDADLVIKVADFDPKHAKGSVINAMGRDGTIDGILCRDDRFAVGALQALRELGVHCPGQVKVVGWDASELSEFTHPTLTSVAPDIQQLAITAVDLLIERIEGHRGIGRHHLVPFDLSIRESTAPKSLTSLALQRSKFTVDMSL